MGKIITNRIKQFVEYLLGDRKRSIIIAIICSILPMFSWLAVVILSLVTLRKGAREGLYVLVGILVPIIIISLLKGFGGVLAPIGFVVSWLLAIVLKDTMSWRRVIEVGVLLAIVSVIIFHYFVPDTQQYWINIVGQGIDSVESTANVEASQATFMNLIQNTAQYMTGLLVVLIFLTILGNLLIARWVQAILYNPTGLAKELRAIRIDWMHVLVIAIISLGMWMNNLLAYDLLTVILVPFIISGMSLVHFIANTTKYTGYLLLAFYCLLLVFSPYIVGILTIVVLADLGLDFRGRFIKQV